MTYEKILAYISSADGFMGPEVVAVFHLVDLHRSLVLAHKPEKDVEIGVAVGGVRKDEGAIPKFGEELVESGTCITTVRKRGIRLSYLLDSCALQNLQALPVAGETL